MKIAVGSVLVALTSVLAGVASVHAQYPARTIRFIVPFAAGSGTDTVARLVQPQLSRWAVHVLFPKTYRRPAGGVGGASAGPRESGTLVRVT